MERFFDYWATWVLAAMGAALTGAWAWVVRKYLAIHRQQTANNAGTLALLKDRLFQSCSFYINRGWCTVTEREALEALFSAYTTMGGNGTGKDLYNAVRALPFTEDKHE